MERGADPMADAEVRRVTVIELLGYAGAAAGLAATVAAIGQAQSLSETVTLLIMLAVAGVLAGAGFLLGRAHGAPFERMRSVFWFVAVEAWGSAVAVFVLTIADVTGRGAIIASGLLTTLGAGIAWFFLRRPLQQIALYAGVLGLVIAVLIPTPEVGSGDPTATVVVVWIVGIAWAIAGFRGVITPARTAMVLGTITAVVAPLLFPDPRIVGELLSLASAVAALVLGERIGDRAISGLGVVGVLVVTALVVAEHLGDSSGGTLISLVVGLVLLAGSVLLARSSPSGGAAPPTMPPQAPAPPPTPAPPPAP